eukprot:scaffold1596_cov302-Pinguiococcus_pyrenoidosus.AAC.76
MKARREHRDGAGQQRRRHGGRGASGEAQQDERPQSQAGRVDPRRDAQRSHPLLVVKAGGGGGSTAATEIRVFTYLSCAPLLFSLPHAMPPSALGT